MFVKFPILLKGLNDEVKMLLVFVAFVCYIYAKMIHAHCVAMFMVLLYSESQAYSDTRLCEVSYCIKIVVFHCILENLFIHATVFL